MANKKKIGVCIYCNSAEDYLSDEHIIPRSICPKGKEDMILLKASCESCQKITSKIERVFNTHYADVREFLNLKAYRRGGKNKKIKKRTGLRRLYSEDEKTAIELPIKNAMPFLLLPYPVHPPRMLTGEEKRDIHNKGYMWIEVLGDTDPRLVDSDLASLVKGVDIGDYFRIYAKIAHAAYIFKNEKINFKPFLVDFILNEKVDYSPFIGGKHSNVNERSARKTTGGESILHNINLQEVVIQKKLHFIVYLNLFFYFNSPTITLIVGERI